MLARPVKATSARFHDPDKGATGNGTGTNAMKRLAVAAGAATSVLLGAGASAYASATRSVTGAETPKQIIAAAKAATLHATNVTINVREESGGEPTAVLITGRYPTYVKVAVSAAGQSEGLVVHGSISYFEASASVWQSGFKLGAPAAASLAGRWYTTSSSDPLLGSSVSAVNPKVVERSVFANLALIGNARGLTARHVVVGGRPALVIGNKVGAVYVASTGKPFLLRITFDTSVAKGFEEFNDYDAPLPTVMPASAGELDTVFANAQASDATTTTTSAGG
jgi:hypothetical protein